MWPFSSSYPSYVAAQVGSKGPGASYDYIIVGGGTAGCVLASRLSEKPDTSVLLIERGPVADDWISKVPLISANYYRPGAPAALWKANPIANADGMVLNVVQGEGLGGASRINGAVYTRGIADYNKWKEMGCSGWGYEDLEPYFCKSETSLGHLDSPHRGKSGPWINQVFPKLAYKSLERVRSAVQSLGIPDIKDINSPSEPAVCHVNLDMAADEKGYRASTFHAFLPRHVVSARKANLTICSDTVVSRIHFSQTDGSKPRALGVYFQAANSSGDANVYYAGAKTEVVVCAGAIGSPHLLMLSGIGPASHLQTVGVSVLKDLPGVGSYLRDHIIVPVSFEIPMEDSMHVLRNRPLRAIWELLRYLTVGTSLFSIPFLQSSIFVRSNLLNKNMEVLTGSLDSSLLDSRLPEDLPDIEIMPVPHRSKDAEHDEVDSKGVFTLLTALLQPLSFGSVRLVNLDPTCRAAVDLGYFAHSEDCTRLRAGIRFARRIAESMREQGYSIKDLRVPMSDSDTDIDAYIREKVQTSYHYTSTCRMAPENDLDHPGVVDEELRVHGIDGLRVCDTSIFPDILTTHTMAGAVVAAEKCADLIKTSQVPYNR